MERTQAILKEMGRILTEDSRAQEVMVMLAEKAQDNGATAEQWEQFKTSMMTVLFYDLAQKDENVMNAFGMDLYEQFTA